jgi:hypothetical protein
MGYRRRRPTGAALIAAVATALLLSGCGATPATMAKLLEEHPHSFDELTEAEEIYCTPGEGYGGRETFDCHWHAGKHAKNATFEILPGNIIGRLSEGGGDPAPPRSAAEATAIVNSAQLQHSSEKGNSKCFRVVKESAGGVTSMPAHTYSCYLLSPYTQLAIPWSEGALKGQPARIRWAWNSNGTVRENRVDTTKPDEQVLEGTPPALETQTAAIEELETVEGKFGISPEMAESESGGGGT